MRELRRPYLNKIQEQTQVFLNERIKHNVVDPVRGLDLDLSISECEILISANSNVRTLADKGDLQKIHAKYNDLHGKVEVDYAKIRTQFGDIIKQVEQKENELVLQLREMGVEKLRLHTGSDDVNFFDAVGFATGLPSFNNLIMVETAIENNHPQKEQLEEIKNKLHNYMGVLARYFEIKVEVREEYVKKVAKGDPEAL